MAVTIRNSESFLSNEKLEEVERRLAIQLPAQYRHFLLAHNGGRPTPNVFHFKNQRGTDAVSCIDWFLAIYDGEHDNFETYFSWCKTDDVRMPLELVPIAHDPGGNLVCIAIAGAQCGAVYFWDHEQESDDPEGPSYLNVHLIADSFDEFLNGLSLSASKS